MPAAGFIASTRTLRLPLAEAVERLYDMGFRRIDVNYANLERSGVDDPSVLSHFRWALLTAARLGADPVTLHAPWEDYFLLPLGQGVERALAEARLLLDMAYSYGVEVVVFHPLPAKHVGSHRVEWLNKRIFSALAEYSEREGLSIVALENASRSGPWNRLERLAALIRSVASPRLRVCYDTGHGNLNGYSPGRAAEILGDMMACIHLHDNDGTRDEHAPPGTGAIDWSQAGMLDSEALKRVVLEIDCMAEPRVCGLHIKAAEAAARLLLGPGG
ncbi:hypothetical protein CF15_00055 [Pyrodictium occultum]|uniref:Xylose isomerase-like TIM barrel domain-containing protein n=1 Tax=Pyrodictium occultum TaxID=2309 RepID=A0A0V8RTC5_PYROC|nr:sugar phosphate isomerase/epimerase family protein [Pyrodictium occultum]KSW11305.1 hypothetical protein CF15_00055 [Pyrodictium occultum]